MRTVLACTAVALSAGLCLSEQAPPAKEQPPAWAEAHLRQPMNAEETRAFIKKLAQFVHDNHLRRDANSAQRGMVYEYLDMTRKGQLDQFVQGEALDTMHDGAWLAAALVTAYRATGDRYYKDFLTEYLLPFYCKMLNHSDTLFSAKRNDARPGAHQFNKEHALQEGEKGFVPYWWDDGGSVSLERRRDKNALGPFACTDHLAGKPNPKFLLDGYSHGSSNHLAQDLGVMLELAWLMLRESKDDGDRKLAAEVAEAAKNLQACRMRHHGHIPMCDAPAALALGDAALMKHVPDQSTAATWTPANHYLRALYSFEPGKRYAFTGFADDQQYRYYFGIAKHGGKVPRALAFRTIYDAYTEPMLYRYYSDDAPVPAGINRFDLHPYYCKDGRPEDYRSDRKGPFGKARPIGSRMGPQNMVCCGWGLQLLKANPGLWGERYRKDFPKDIRVYIENPLSVELPGLMLQLVSTRGGVRLGGLVKGNLATFKLFGQPDAKGPYANLTVSKSKGFAAVNDKGERLNGHGRLLDGTGDSFSFVFSLPYTVTKREKQWANGVEHGRYSIQVGKEVRNLYLASSEEEVKDWLKHELSGGLRTWEAIFQERGYIPTGIGAGEWDGYSDCGGYAHLINAASQWLLYLEGKSDWEQHHVPTVAGN